MLPFLLGLGPATVSCECLGLAGLEYHPLSPWLYAVVGIVAHIFSLLVSARFLEVLSCACVG